MSFSITSGQGWIGISHCEPRRVLLLLKFPLTEWWNDWNSHRCAWKEGPEPYLGTIISDLRVGSCVEPLSNPETPSNHPEQHCDWIATLKSLSNYIAMPWPPPTKPQHLGGEFCMGKHHAGVLQKTYKSIFSFPSSCCRTLIGWQTDVVIIIPWWSFCSIWLHAILIISTLSLFYSSGVLFYKSTQAFLQLRGCGSVRCRCLLFRSPHLLFTLHTLSSVVHLCTRCSCSMFPCSAAHFDEGEREETAELCLY